MANTSSAKKVIRSSQKKRLHNISWKNRIKQGIKNLESLLKSQASAEQLNKSLSQVQKTLDKASKENVLHKNKTNRLKSKLALKLTGNATKPTAKKSTKSSK